MRDWSRLWSRQAYPVWAVFVGAGVASWALDDILNAAQGGGLLAWLLLLIAAFCAGWLGAVILVGGETVQLFPNRTAVESKYPIRDQLKSGNEVWAIWVAGSGVFQQSDAPLRESVIKRLILPHPETEYLDTLRKSIPTGELHRIKEDIRHTTNLALEHKVPVRWFRGFTGVNVLIGNPDKRDAWVHLEPCLPCFQPGDRQILRIEKRTRRAEFTAYRNYFDSLWQLSEDAPATDAD